jgi:hypothetical protein
MNSRLFKNLQSGLNNFTYNFQKIFDKKISIIYNQFTLK